MKEQNPSLKIAGQMKAQPEKLTWKIEAFWMHTEVRALNTMGWSSECVHALCVKREKDSKCYTKRCVPVLKPSSRTCVVWSCFTSTVTSSVLRLHSHQLTWAGMVSVLCAGRLSSYLHCACILLTCNRKVSIQLSSSMKTLIKACVQ